MPLWDVLQSIRQITPLLRAGAAYALHFGAAKVFALIAVLAVPRLVSVDLYARVDFANAVAALGAQIVGLGFANAAARMHLAEGLEKPSAVAILSLIWTALVGLLVAAAALALGLPVEYAFCGLLAVLLGLQNTLVSLFRAGGHLKRAPWADGTAPFIVVAAAIGTVVLFDGRPVGMLVFLGAAAIGTLLGGLWLLPAAATELNRAIVGRAARVGLSLLLVGLAQQILTATPKVTIGEAISVDAVAIFAVAVHCALPLIVVNQFAVLGSFRRVFQAEAAIIDKVFSFWILGLAAAGALLALLAKYLAIVATIGTQVDAVRVAAVLPAVAILVVGWILIADLETLIARQGVWLKTLFPTLSVGLVGLVVGWLDYRAGTLSLARVAALYGAVFIGVSLAQMFVLHRSGLTLRRSLICLIGCTIAVLLFGIF